MNTFAERIANLSHERLKLLALRLREQLEQSENSRTEPIAIIGLGCRFPGAPNPEAFWELLREGRDAISTIPAERFDCDRYFDPSPHTAGKMYTRHGGFIEGFDQFDPQFFGIAPREAASMDPQQRLLLEVVWEALENAGQAPSRLEGAAVGVFVGVSTYDYLQLSCRHGSLGQINPYTGTGCSFSIASGRLSYILGLSGPNFPVDTACSSSLVSLHLACQSLRNQECRLALAGGVNLLMAPDPFIYFCKVHALSPDGTCKTFDASANGYVRGEGCGIVVLKRLSEALADRDPILAVIRGSAINHDGRSSGLTVPNHLAQEAVIRQALFNAGLVPQDIDYVEAHGTGTPLGDPIEVQALGASLGMGRTAATPLMVGAVKTNIGHLEAAAGVAGLIKVVLALQHRQIPPHLHFQQPNTFVSWKDLPIEVVTALRPWPERGQPLRAGVSSFGFSGTNAHVIVEAAPAIAPDEPAPERVKHLLCVSAKDDETLRKLADSYARRLASPDAPRLADAAFTANTGRSHFGHRLTVLATDAAEAGAALSTVTEGGRSAAIAQSQISPHATAKVAFLFTGQGSQYVGMGRELDETQPTFHRALDRCEEILRPHLALPLRAVLYPEDGVASPLNDTAYTQPALFALEYALAELWRSWGVEPSCVLGHSIGQYVAACLAGVFSIEDGLTLIAQRARLMQALPRGGGMAAVLAPEAVVAEACLPFGEQVAIAAVNGPANVVVSGSLAALQALEERFGAAGINVQRLNVSHAFHSPLLEPMLADFERVAGTLAYAPPRLTLVCNDTGQPAQPAEITTPHYWRRHARQTVRFTESVATLDRLGCDVCIELGPQPTLISLARQCGTKQTTVWLPSLRKQSGAWQVLLEAVQQAYLKGVAVDWKGFDRDYRRRVVSMPTYPFRRQRYALDYSTGPTEEKPTPEATSREPVPQKVSDWLYEVRWESKPLARPRPSQAEGGSWLLFVDGTGVATVLAERLKQLGQESLLVSVGSNFARLGESNWCINPLEKNGFERLFEELASHPLNPLRGIIHFGSLDIAAGTDILSHKAPLAPVLRGEGSGVRGSSDQEKGPLTPTPLPGVPGRGASGTDPELTAETLDQDQARGSASVLHLVQALLARLGRTPPPPLWLITRGAQAVPAGSAVPGLGQTPLWGLGSVLVVEQPNWRSTLVDLDPNVSAQVAVEHLCSLLSTEEREPQQALRNGERFVARLVRRPDVAGRGQLTICPDGSYLITGGLGGLGLLTAKWLVERGARHLVLVGRRPAGVAAMEPLTELMRTAKVHCIQANVTRAEELARVLAEAAAQLPPVRGIIHAAGLFDASLMENLSWSRFAEILRPKLAGAWNLHQQTRNLPLDFFVCYSSMASVLPSPGQAHYAGANAFLDALAHARRAAGLPALAINWGPWAEVGMGQRLTGDLRRRWQSLGLPEIETAGGLTALAELLGADVPQVSVMPIEWNKLFHLYPAGLEPAFLTRIAQQERRREPPSPEWQRLSEQLRKAQRKEQDHLLAQYAKQQLAGVLGLDVSQPIAHTTGFFELGMDSLMAVELRNRLQRDLGDTHPVPVTLVFDAPTLAALVEYLRDKVLALDEARAEPAPTQLQHTTEPIAVIGYACRFPGGVRDPAGFWKLLREGVDAIREVPPERWDLQAYYDPDPAAPGKMYTRHSGFLHEIDQFDAHFFGISPREAVRMDPQQRLLLEVAWEALEHACQPPDQLAGSLGGIFVGISSNDYVRLLASTGDLSQIDAYLGVGNALSIAAGRLAHFLGLRGPCLAVDTACSSSLVAVDLACESLHHGKARLALAGGVNLMLTPEPHISLCKAHMLAPDGHCKTFDAAADGYVRSEGCALLVLKRLSDAQADGDRVHALIQGSAVNHDGRSGGLTVPSGPAQEELLRQALANAGLQPADIDFVETHGTGTPLGDPIEVRALGEVMAKGRSAESPLLLGAVKSNIGHLEAAAGAAGLIKVILALQHREIPANLHFHQPNPYIPWQDYPLEVVTEHRPWPSRSGVRRAGISSFGFSGTNAHVIVEESPERPPAPDAGAPIERPLHLLCLSAKQPTALRDLARAAARCLRTDPAPALADVCFTTNAGRAHLNHRLAVVAATAADAAAALAAHAEERPAHGLTAAHFQGGDRPRPVFLFSGQGTPYPGMGRQLFETQPTFRCALERCAAILEPLVGWSLVEVLYDKPENEKFLGQTMYAQPALFALEYALAELWRSWGIEPAAVLGHSVGEYVAACVAGVFSLEEGLRLIADRGRLMQALPADGAMATVFADEEQVRNALARATADVAIACLNGPGNTVISGRRAAIEAVVANLGRQGVRSQFLNVSHAFHSPLVEPMLDEFEQNAGRVAYRTPRVPLISNLTGRPAEGTEAASAGYWRRHAREPVRFAAGMAALAELGYAVFLELGPGTTLLNLGRQSLSDERFVWLPSLRKAGQDWEQMLRSLQTLYLHGAAVDWKRFDRDYPRRWVDLPAYPFQRTRYWLEGTPSPTPAAARPSSVQAARGHVLLGERLRSPIVKETIYQNRFQAEAPAFLGEHRIYSMVVVPGACHLAMLLSALDRGVEKMPFRINDVSFPEPLILPEGEARLVQLIFSSDAETGAGFRVLSAAEDEEATWSLHAAGTLPAQDSSPPETANGHAHHHRADWRVKIQERCPDVLATGQLIYKLMHQLGLQLGPSFQWIQQVWRREGEALACLRSPRSPEEADPYVLHPGLLDSCFQTLGATFASQKLEQSAYIPISIERLVVHRRPSGRLWNHARLRPTVSPDGQTFVGDLTVLDDDNNPVLEISGLRVRRAPRTSLLRFAHRRLLDAVYSLRWLEEATPPPTTPKPGGWLIFADEGGLGLRLAEQLPADGDHCVVVHAGSAYAAENPTRLRMDPRDPAHFQRLYQETIASGSWSGVVFLWSVEPTSGEMPTWVTFLESQSRGSEAFLLLVQVLGKLRGQATPRLWLITRAVQALEDDGHPSNLTHAPLWGLCRVLALEHPALRPTCIDLPPVATGDDARWLLGELRANDREDQLAFRRGKRFAARLFPGLPAGKGGGALTVPQGKPYRLLRSEHGTLADLRLEVVPRQTPRAQEVEILVHATGLNFRDVLNALNVYPGDAGPLGGECAGTVTAVDAEVKGLAPGDRVVAIAAGTFARYVTTDAAMVVRLPDGIDFEEATTLPVTFVTAQIALAELAHLAAGDKVLIHAAAGGVGLAAVQLALRAGAEVLATAGSPAKREFLHTLGVRHVFDSRSLDFADGVRAATQGRGVTVVLNSLAGEFIERSFAVLAPGGRFVEIGKRDIWDREKVAARRPDVAYHTIALDELIVQQPRYVGELLHNLVGQVAAGQLKPLPHTVFPLEEAASAFRYMARAQHLGKIVVSHPTSDRAMAAPGVIRGDGTYLITGGLGGLGLTTARWLVDQGARSLVLVSRRAPSAAAQVTIAELRAAGATVHVRQADCSQREDLQQLLGELEPVAPPLRGIFHLAGLLDDAILLRQEWRRFVGVYAPKVAGALHLHELTRHQPLDMFVLFSSVAALFGFPSQGSYAAANTFLDRFAQHRRACGLPAQSINWGPWSEVGMAAGASSHVQQQWGASGIGVTTPTRALATLELLLQENVVQAAVLPIDWRRLQQRFPAGAQPPFLTQVLTTQAQTREPSKEWLQFVQAVTETLPGERRDLVIEYLQNQAGRVLGLDPSQPPGPRTPLSDLGFDSLMAVEWANQLGAAAGVSIPVTTLFDYPTIDALADFVLREVLKLEGAAPRAEVQPKPVLSVQETTETLLESIESLSDEQIEDLFRK